MRDDAVQGGQQLALFNAHYRLPSTASRPWSIGRGGSWARPEHLAAAPGANLRFVRGGLPDPRTRHRTHPAPLYEDRDLPCAATAIMAKPRSRSNSWKTCSPTATSSATMTANQLRLWFSSIGLAVLLNDVAPDRRVRSHPDKLPTLLPDRLPSQQLVKLLQDRRPACAASVAADQVRHGLGLSLVTNLSSRYGLCPLPENASTAPAA